jgi:hypothetical protein
MHNKDIFGLNELAPGSLRGHPFKSLGVAGVGPSQQFELMGESYKNGYEKGFRGAFLPRKMPLYEISQTLGTFVQSVLGTI